MRLWLSKALRQTPIDPLCAERDNIAQSPSLRSSYSASPPSQALEGLCSVSYWYVIVTPCPFILLSAFIESHELPSSCNKKGLRDWIDVPAIVH